MEQSSDPADNHRVSENQMSEEEIDQTLEESFPASDPPQWTLGVETHAEPTQEEAAESDGGDKDEASP